MPHVKPGESRSEYLSRCVPECVSEGLDKKAAVGKCQGMYDEKFSANAVAATGGNTFIPGNTDEENRKYSADAEYETVDNVPIFDETSGYSPDDLQLICDNNNRRIQDTGEYVPLIIGHTADNSDETENEVVGYATNFRMGNIGNLKPRVAIIATFKYFKDKYDRAKDFTRRSVELWPDEMFIDPIALLGPHTPHCDLGLTPRLHVQEVATEGEPMFAYSKQGRKFVCESEEKEATNDTYFQTQRSKMDKEEVIKELMSKLEQSDVFQYVREEMKRRAEKAKSDEEEDKKEEEPEPEKHEAAEDKKEDKEEDKEEKEEKFRLRGDVERFRREADITKKELDVIKRKFRRAERERDLVKLETQEGVIFDLPEELEAITDLTDEQYSRHVERMRKRYQRLPDATHLRPQINENGVEKKFDETAMWSAINLARKENIPYEQAVSKVKGG